MPSSQDDPLSEPEQLADLTGTLLGERYQLGRVLGAGGMGAVFEGKDLRLGRPVAIKVIRPGLARDAEYNKRFLREAQTASMVRHRNVVVILDYGKAEGGLLYSVMEFLVGQDLEELLRGLPGERLPWAQACGLLVQIASGLKAAHEQGVIHRDIKPANCFLTHEDDEPVIKLVDFGIAKLDDAAQTQQLTSTGNVLGTPSYTAPEMVLTSGPASPRSDVYSLGVVAYRMLTGVLPFTGNTAFEVMHHACMKPAPPLRPHVAELPEAVEQLVLEMLAKEPEERPADMGVLRQRLRALGRDGLGVERVEAGGSSSMRIELGGVGASGEVERTAVLEEVSGQAVAVPPEQQAEVVIERTTLLDSGSIGRGVEHADTRVANAAMATMLTPTRSREETRPGNEEASGSTLEPSQPREETRPGNEEASGSRLVPREPSESPRRSAGWLAAGGLVLVAALGGVAWTAMSGQKSEVVPESVRELAAVEPSRAREEAQAPPLKADAKEPPVVEPSEPEPTVAVERAEPEPPVEVDDPPVVEQAEPEPPEPDAPVEPKKKKTASKPDHPPAGPPSDAALRKKIERKIKAKCADLIAGRRVTVSFFVTKSGGVDSLTATPKDAAGECAKQQVVGTKFQARSGEETAIKIVVG